MIVIEYWLGCYCDGFMFDEFSLILLLIIEKWAYFVCTHQTNFANKHASIIIKITETSSLYAIFTKQFYNVT